MTTGNHHLLRLGNCSGRVEIFGTGIRAIHDRVTSVQLEGILQTIQPFIGRFIPGINEPSVRSQQHRWTQKPFAVPPVARATGGTARAKDARRR